MGHLLQAAFSVALGRGRVAVNGAEIALPVDQRQAQRPVLCHTRQRIIDRGIAMRVIFTHDIAGDAGAFDVFLVPVHAHFGHAVEDTAVHRLQAVTNIRQRAADDHAHRVIEIGTLHFLHDGDGLDARRKTSARRCRLISQCESRSQARIIWFFIAESDG